MDDVYVITFLFWPAVVLLSAGINMLVSWTFSWSELIFDLLIGFVAGIFCSPARSPLRMVGSTSLSCYRTAFWLWSGL